MPLNPKEEAAIPKFSSKSFTCRAYILHNHPSFHNPNPETEPRAHSVIRAMASIGALIFCTACGSLLDPNTGRTTHLTCSTCGTRNLDSSSKVVVTHSKPSAFPSTLRTRLRSDVQEMTEEDMQTEATIKHTCEKCGTEEVRYHERQLRGADEGSTIFYTCPGCGWRWNTNN